MKQFATSVLFILMLLLFSSKITNAQKDVLSQTFQLQNDTTTITELLMSLELELDISFVYGNNIDVSDTLILLKGKYTLANIIDIAFNHKVLAEITESRVLLIPAPEVKRIVVKGLVLMGRSNKPIAYASVYKKNTTIGTVTNDDGEFKLVYNSSGNDTLVASFLGYEMNYVVLPVAQDTTVLLTLETQMVKIEEVLIRPLNPFDIIEKAVSKISENYMCEPYLGKAFFREKNMQGKEYIAVSEALVDIYKASYCSIRTDQVKISKSRKSADVISPILADLVVQGGLFHNLKLDIIKNRANFLDPEYLEFYKYEIEDVTKYKGEMVYVISFEEYEEKEFLCYKGEIYVEVNTMAVVYCEFKFSDATLEKASNLIVKKKPMQLRVRPVSATYQVFYRRNENNLWYLHYARSDIKIRAKEKGNRRNRRESTLYTSISEYVITDISLANVRRFKSEEVAKPGEIFAEEVDDFSEKYWDGYTVILPEEPVEKAMKRLGDIHGVSNTIDEEPEME